MMVETDYENYAAYIECDEVNGYNFPVISSTSTEIDPLTLGRLTQLLQDLGGNMDAFTEIRHDLECNYFYPSK